MDMFLQAFEKEVISQENSWVNFSCFDRIIGSLLVPNSDPKVMIAFNVSGHWFLRRSPCEADISRHVQNRYKQGAQSRSEYFLLGLAAGLDSHTIIGSFDWFK